jgi:hypothetical protein
MLPFSFYEHEVSANTKRSCWREGKKGSTVHNHSHADSILLRRNKSGYKILPSNSVNLFHVKGVL